MFFGPLGANFRENHVTPRIHVNAVEQEGADLGHFRDFSRPEKHLKYDNKYVGFLGGVFKNSNFRENVLNPPSPVRPLLEAFSCFASPPPPAV